MLKSRGPNKDPRGTPLIISCQELYDEPIFVLCLRREIVEINKSPTLSITYAFNLTIKRSCGIQSYDLDRSIKTVATIPFSSNSFCHDCNNLNMRVACYALFESRKGLP